MAVPLSDLTRMPDPQQVHAADGTRLTFAFYAIGDGIQDEAKEALDTLTTAVYTCGNNLARF